MRPGRALIPVRVFRRARNRNTSGKKGRHAPPLDSCAWHVRRVYSMPGTTVEKPPSTWVISPVTPAARSDIRKAATLPTSSMVTLRRKGAWVSTYLSMVEKSFIPLAAKVLIRSEERRVGKECVSMCRSRGSTDLSKKKTKQQNFRKQ